MGGGLRGAGERPACGARRASRAAAPLRNWEPVAGAAAAAAQPRIRPSRRGREAQRGARRRLARHLSNSLIHAKYAELLLLPRQARPSASRLALMFFLAAALAGSARAW